MEDGVASEEGVSLVVAEDEEVMLPVTLGVADPLLVGLRVPLGVTVGLRV